MVLGPLRPDELLVDIHATGICHTDVACMNGTLPMRLPQVLGHEGILIAEFKSSLILTNIQVLGLLARLVLTYSVCILVIR